MKVQVMSMNNMARWGKLNPDTRACGVISIRTPNLKGEDQYPPYLNEAIDAVTANKLILLFDDATQGIEPFTKLFKESQARQIIDFVADKTDLLVHCDAGMSRSVAVGAFLRDCYGADLTLVNASSDRFYNVLVYTTLKRVGGFTPIGA